VMLCVVVWCCDALWHVMNFVGWREEGCMCGVLYRGVRDVCRRLNLI
jgi:hypothetical protein